MQLKLHTEIAGWGTDLFLVHGWALHGGIWSGVLPELAQTYRVTCVDLPGHGLSRDLPMPAMLPELAQQLVEAAPENAVWLGWSLGGLACLRAALDFPGRIRALVLVSTTPCFITAADWPHAMPLEQLQELASELGRDYHKAVQRFLALQVRGDVAERATLRQLRKAVFARGEPRSDDLANGLQLLRASDLRAELAQIHLPTLVVTGEYDRLTPLQAGVVLAAAVGGAQRVVIPKTAHAPFLSRPAEFSAALKQFLRNLPDTTVTQAGDHRRIPAQRAHKP
ncbi:MAG TPA: pimeloyl-ACP methyl ester esterase BioH [Gammaproteobacteria bacterium]|nr:pimeloyl-ACP methyl ester esterase BioH [Gammaproteobacteria bacterium]